MILLAYYFSGKLRAIASETQAAAAELLNPLVGLNLGPPSK